MLYPKRGLKSASFHSSFVMRYILVLAYGQQSALALGQDDHSENNTLSRPSWQNEALDFSRKLTQNFSETKALDCTPKNLVKENEGVLNLMQKCGEACTDSSGAVQAKCDFCGEGRCCKRPGMFGGGSSSGNPLDTCRGPMGGVEDHLCVANVEYPTTGIVPTGCSCQIQKGVWNGTRAMALADFKGVCDVGHECLCSNANKSMCWQDLRAGKPLGTCEPCLLGQHCAVPGHLNPTGMIEANGCVEGMYCASPSGEPKKCPAGYFCEAGTWEPAECIVAGSHCPEGTVLPNALDNACPAGFYCPTAALNLTCPADHYCPMATVDPVPCPVGAACGEGMAHPSFSWLAFLIGPLVVGSVFALCWGVDKKWMEQMKSGDDLGSSSNQDADITIAKLLIARFGCGAALADDDSRGTKFKGFVQKAQGMTIEFNELGLELPSGKKVLAGVTGRFEAGRVIAVMGPSGAGKTTFLNTLAGKAGYGETTGVVKINGMVVDNVSEFRSVTGFVPQDDTVHFGLTVQENLYFASQLRAPRDASAETKRNVVEDCLKVLQVTHISHSVVGDPNGERGISGGQRKRVSIGMELAATPTLLLLDEPTSGLDATASLQVIGSLKEIANLGTTVLMVIHQPRYSLFTMFNDVLLLGKGGRTVYLGPSIDAVGYFESLGFPCPGTENPADFVLDVIGGDVQQQGNPDFDPQSLFDTWVQKGSEYLKKVSRDRSEAMGLEEDTESAPPAPPVVAPEASHQMAPGSSESTVGGNNPLDALLPPAEGSPTKVAPEASGSRASVARASVASTSSKGAPGSPKKKAAAKAKKRASTISRASVAEEGEIEVAPDGGPIQASAPHVKRLSAAEAVFGAQPSTATKMDRNCDSVDKEILVNRIGNPVVQIDDLWCCRTSVSQKGEQAVCGTGDPLFQCVDCKGMIISRYKWLRRQEARKVARNEIAEAFKKWDVKKQGRLYDEDLRVVLKDLLRRKPSREEMDFWMNLFKGNEKEYLQFAQRGTITSLNLRGSLTPGKMAGMQAMSKSKTGPGVSEQRFVFALDRFIWSGLNLQKAGSTSKSFFGVAVKTEVQKSDGGSDLSRIQVGWFGIFLLIVKRFGCQWWRRKKDKLIDLGLCLVGSTLLGAMQRGNWELFFLASMHMLSSLTLALLNGIGSLKLLVVDKPIIWREKASGIPNSALFCGRMVVDIIDLVLRAFLYTSMWYCIANPFISFGDCLGVHIMVCWVTSGMGYFLAAACPQEHSRMATTLLILVLGGIWSGTSPPLKDMNPLLSSVSFGRWYVEWLTMLSLKNIMQTQPHLEWTIHEYAVDLIGYKSICPETFGFENGQLKKQDLTAPPSSKNGCTTDVDGAVQIAFWMVFLMGAFLRALTPIAMTQTNKDKQI